MNPSHLEHLRRDFEESAEASLVYSLNEQEEVRPVLWELFEVLINHLERALEHGVEDLWNLWCDHSFQTINDCGHCRENFRFSSCRDVRSVI